MAAGTMRAVSRRGGGGRFRGALAAGLLAAACAAFAAEAPGPPGGPHAGEVRCTPTWSCMGINWYVGDPNDLAGSVRVAYRRKGTDGWREAMGLLRHLYGRTTMFSGSVFRLCPGTEYEFRLTRADASGRAVEQRTVAARTLDYPRMPARTVAVPPGGGLLEAQKLAAPGTVMLIPAGTYPGAKLEKSGEPGRWIVYRPAGDGEVVIAGRVEVRADYVWLHGLRLRDPKNAVQGSHKGVCITACRIRSHYAIHTARGGENYFIADNRLVGDANGQFSFSGEGVDFGSGRGRCGHAVCYNDITDFADGVSYGRGDIDVYGNAIHETVDDFIEPDYAYENYRLWGNLCHNTMCGFSFQPMKGGPWYIFHNVNVGAYLHALKLKDVTGPTVLYGNTMLTKSSRLGQGADILRGRLLNNAWLRCTPGPLAGGGRFRPGVNDVRVDYNAYGTGGREPFAGVGYGELAAEHGWDRHSLHVDFRRVFQEDVRAPAGEPYYSSKLQGKPLPPDWRFEHYLLLPRPGGPLVDAGVVVPNLTGPYLGKAPDIGAHELGLGVAWYGPRRWDLAAKVVYGLPAGWTARHEPPPAGPAGRPTVRLACASSPAVEASIAFRPAAGEARWAGARAVVADPRGAATGILEFQDGLYVRLYRSAGRARLLAGRIEPDGFLRIEARCAAADLPRARLDMFRFVRSFVR